MFFFTSIKLYNITLTSDSRRNSQENNDCSDILMNLSHEGVTTLPEDDQSKSNPELTIQNMKMINQAGDDIFFNA